MRDEIKPVIMILIASFAILACSCTSTVTIEPTLPTKPTIPTESAMPTETVIPTEMVIPTESATPSVPVTGENEMLESLEQLKKSGAKENNIVITKGYYTTNDGGGATYKITNSALEDDGFLCIRLDNGLKAELVIPAEKELNVLCAGLKAGEPCSDRLNYIIKAVHGKADTLIFNDGRYIIDQSVSLLSMKYQGNGNTEFYIPENYNAKNNIILSNTKEFNETGTGKKIEFENLKFLIEASQKHSLIGQEITFLCLRGVEECTISGCEFTARQAKEEGAFIAVDLLWFQKGNAKNITVTNSKFYNQTAVTGGKPRNVGGCIWISPLSHEFNVENITIDQCEFFSYASDEIVGVWRAGKVENFTIRSCKFTIDENNINNVISFNQASYKNVAIEDSIFNINTGCMYIIKMLNDNENNTYDVKISNCDFNLISNLKSPVIDNISIFLVKGLKQWDTVTVEDSRFKSSGDTQFRTFMTINQVENAQMVVKNNQIDMYTSDGVLWSEKSSGRVDILDNYINIRDEATFLVIRDTPATLDLNVIKNKIYGRVYGLMQGAVILNYRLTDNYVSCDKTSIIFFNSNLVEQNDKSTLVEKNNEFTDPKLVKIYGSKLATEQDRFLIIKEK